MINKNIVKLGLLSLTLTVLAACNHPTNSELTGTPEVYVPPQRPVFPDVAELPVPERPVYPKVQPLPVPERPVYPKVEQNQAPPPPAAKEKYTQREDLMGQKAVPMDILFVVDTSASMCSDQANLARNINRFVDLFLQNDKIDFHIGVTVTWDSRLYGNAVRKFKNGELRPVYGQGQNVRFVTPKTPNLRNTLAKTLAVGFENYDPKRPDISGPENEELFSPILAALSDDMQSGANQGFRRPEAHLAVVIVTDTEDATPDPMNPEDPKKSMSASYVAQELQSKVRGDATVTVLAALARLDEMLQFKAGKNPGLTSFNKKFPNGTLSKCNSYTVDPAIVDPLKGPEQIENLVSQLKGTSFDLSTKDFGGKMAGMGQTLLNKAMSFKIRLDKVPDVSEPITLKINGKIVRRDDLKTWSYDPSNNSITLNESLNLGGMSKFHVEIDYTVLN